MMQVGGWLAFVVALVVTWLGAFPLPRMLWNKLPLIATGFGVTLALRFAYRRFLHRGAPIWQELSGARDHGGEGSAARPRVPADPPLRHRERCAHPRAATAAERRVHGRPALRARGAGEPRVRRSAAGRHRKSPVDPLLFSRSLPSVLDFAGGNPLSIKTMSLRSQLACACCCRPGVSVGVVRFWQGAARGSVPRFPAPSRSPNAARRRRQGSVRQARRPSRGRRARRASSLPDATLPPPTSSVWRSRRCRKTGYRSTCSSLPETDDTDGDAGAAKSDEAGERRSPSGSRARPARHAGATTTGASQLGAERHRLDR